MAKAKRPSKPAKKTEPRARPKKAVGHDKRVSAFKKNVKVKEDEKPAAATGPVMRVTHPSNGAMPNASAMPAPAMSSGEAIRRALDELGEMNIDPEVSESMLRRIGEAFENKTKEAASLKVKLDAVKTAREALKSADEYLTGLIKEATHPQALPLFDATREQKDREAMEAGPVDVETEDGGVGDVLPAAESDDSGMDAILGAMGSDGDAADDPIENPPF